MRAIFSPGPSYYQESTRTFAGWTIIFDHMKQALEQLGHEVWMPRPNDDVIDDRTTVSKMTSWDLWAAAQMPMADLFLGPPGYSLAQILRFKAMNPGGKAFCYVWNNADWWRDQQLAEEMKTYGRSYDLSAAWRWINHQALAFADRVVACSPFVADTHAKLAGVGPEKIDIAFWGVDAQRFTPDWEWQEKHGSPLEVLFVGSDPIRKGLPYLIDALEGLEGVHLTIAGCSAQAPSELAEKITTLGIIPNERMPKLMQRHHAICIPTLEDGIACAIQEGMASGLVPIASPDAAEVFGEWAKKRVSKNEQWGFGPCGIEIGFRDVRAIREALLYLRDHRAERLTMARRARTLATFQTWEHFQDEFKEVIRRGTQHA